MKVLNKFSTLKAWTESFEFPSNILGMAYLDFTRDDYPYKLLDELDSIGCEIDKNSLLSTNNKKTIR